MFSFQSLKLSNFRGFKTSPTVALRPLTFLVGPNSSGKTSLMHALMLLSQSGIGGLNSVEPIWSGSLVDLGSFEDTVFAHSKRSAITIALECGDTHPLGERHTASFGPKLRVEFVLKGSSDPIGYVSAIHLTDVSTGQSVDISRQRGRRPAFTIAINESKLNWSPIKAPDTPAWRGRLSEAIERAISKASHLESIRQTRRKLALTRIKNLASRTADLMASIQRVTSGRSAPERWYSRGKDPERRYWRFFEQTFSGVSPDMLDSSFSLDGRASKQSAEERLADGLERLGIANEIRKEDLSAYHTAIVLTDSLTGIEAKINDFGYGVSQVLPVLRAMMSRAVGPLFVEQPEIHLHPRAQAEIGAMLVKLCQRRQIFVETHSDHLINQARIAVASGELPADWVTIVYVDRTPAGSQATSIGLTPTGDFSREWPDGFFPERYHDTMKLAELKGSATLSIKNSN